MSNSNEFLDTLHENKQKMNKIESAKERKPSEKSQIKRIITIKTA